jgi:DNA recombination protein RmuC
MESIIVIVIFLAGGLGGFFIARHFLLQGKVSIQDFERLNLDKLIAENKLEDDKINNSTRIAEQKHTIEELRKDLQSTRDKASGLEYEKSSNADLKKQASFLSNELQAAKEKNITLETERAIFNEQREAYIKQMKEIQENLKLQFESSGNKIFNENSKMFKTESQARIAELLSPLKGDIDSFKTKLEESFSTHAKEQNSLKSEIARIVKINEQMSSQTSNLTKALKGDFRVQGNWGEVILERILEESGLRAGQDYILQGADMGIKHPDSGQNLKPDVVIRLPEDKHVIIDSKVSLTDYERFCSEENETERLGHLKQFLLSVKKHVNDLEQRRYQDADKLKAPDFVLMFMPIEGAFSLAIQQDQELHSYAWGKKVVIVCPSTLFATLRTIASIWRFELQHRHTLEIAKQGGLLYDKIAGFVTDMQKLGSQLKTSQDTYSTAMSKLSEGKGNILIRTQQLQTLGAKASKNLLKIIPQAFEDPNENLSDEQQQDTDSDNQSPPLID